jgi:hypothetical protein
MFETLFGFFRERLTRDEHHTAGSTLLFVKWRTTPLIASAPRPTVTNSFTWRSRVPVGPV